ncbi:hypothetical protein CLG85_023010 [Yangia mangrovi]|uniref:Uncharacterized protein n=1 Tax=Alloyangia mangrovi TaxID=1779329 RepID=A0ABT2KSA5_9RHOB|nr:hypothetical protein [Alloyangia mangrovi]MCA0940153.1 hypothetical protein [Alloyangia pacifica]MCA0945680.1 hypothetical protein [Alloyangia pacifica]MCT4373015.1 hypothetical protein [Alloyangia mangrovi]
MKPPSGAKAKKGAKRISAAWPSDIAWVNSSEFSEPEKIETHPKNRIPPNLGMFQNAANEMVGPQQ